MSYNPRKEMCKKGNHSIALFETKTGFVVSCIHCFLSSREAAKKKSAKWEWLNGPRIPHSKMVGKLKHLLDAEDLLPKTQIINAKVDNQAKETFRLKEVNNIKLILVFKGSLLEDS